MFGGEERERGQREGRAALSLKSVFSPSASASLPSPSPSVSLPHCLILSQILISLLLFLLPLCLPASPCSWLLPLSCMGHDSNLEMLFVWNALWKNPCLIKSRIMALRGGRSEDIRWSSSHNSLRSMEWQGKRGGGGCCVGYRHLTAPSLQRVPLGPAPRLPRNKAGWTQTHVF